MKPIRYICMLAAILLTVMSCSTKKSNQSTQQFSNIHDEGVIINGVCWATRNVNFPGTFTDKPEGAGMFYLWNNKKAWPSTGDFSNKDYYKLDYTEWKKANDPCPVGWRLPTMDELERLCDTKNVKYKWTKRKGMKGQTFTDITTGNSIFLPAIGYRDLGGISSVHWAGMSGFYWSNTPRENNNEKDGFQYLKFDNRMAGHSAGYSLYMCNIRCVAE